MKFNSKFFTTLIGVFITSLMVSCSPIKELIKPVVEKTYTVTTQVETYINNSTNLVNDVKSVIVPIKTIAIAINFVKDKVTDQEKVENLEKVLLILDQIVFIAENVDQAQADQAKQLLLDKIGQVKKVVVAIGNYAGVDWNALPRANPDIGSILLETAALIEEVDNAQNNKHKHTSDCKH